MAAGIAHALAPAARPGLIAAGLEVCARFSWQRSARRHVELYADFIRCQPMAASFQEEHHA